MWAPRPADDAVPITIVRPSIIESALAEPRPGWIRGFRMAEPIIVSYARGLLREFPGVPEGVIDVIPVDMVVAAILAVAARGPDPDGPVRLPRGLRRAEPVALRPAGRAGPGLVRPPPALRRPGPAHQRPPVVVPRTGAGPAPAAAGHQGHGRGRASWSPPCRSAVGRPRSRPGWRTATPWPSGPSGYVELYGAYTETEARYRVDRLLALADAAGRPADRADFCFDPAVIDWDHYVHDVHLPSVVAHARVRTTPGRSVVDKRPDRARGPSSPPSGTWPSSTSSTPWSPPTWSTPTPGWPAGTCRRASGPRFVAGLLREAPSLLALDRRDRGDFLRSFYRRYEDAPVAVLAEDSWELFHRQLLTRSFPAGFARVREHRRLGHRTLLVTGALDFVIAPLRPLFDDIVCARLGQHDGRYDGRLDELPPIGEARAILLDDYAAAHDLSLDESVAYADSASDLAMLEAVGFPVAVNPESRLAAIARRRGWHVEHWAKASGGAHRPLPLGPLDVVLPGGRRRSTGVASPAIGRRPAGIVSRRARPGPT